MCHIKFALTGRKEGSEDRNAVGINVELGSPFLQGISCLLKRSGPDRELWHSALSHLGVLQLNTHTFSWPWSVCVCVCVCVYVRVSVSCRADHAHRPRTSERTGVSGALGGPLRVDTQDSGTGRTFKSCIFNLKKNKTKQINYHNRAWNFYKWEKTHCQQDLGPANIEEN